MAPDSGQTLGRIDRVRSRDTMILHTSKQGLGADVLHALCQEIRYNGTHRGDQDHVLIDDAVQRRF